MRSSEVLTPVRMQRVALVAQEDQLRELLVEVAGIGVVDVDRSAAGPGTTPADRVLRDAGGRTDADALLAVVEPDLEQLRRDGRLDLLAGEAQLQQLTRASVHHDSLVALIGWCPRDKVSDLSARVAPLGAAAVALPAPQGLDPPTSLQTAGALRGSFTGLVRTYGVVPYQDLDPTVPAGLAYVVMFGMMFGDAGHGALLLVMAILLRAGLFRKLKAVSPLWPFIAAAGLTSILFGFLFGEFFGPTGVLPVVWLSPMDDPTTLLVAAVIVGSVLLLSAYLIALIDRFREGGLRLAGYTASGLPGVLLFTGLILVATGWYAATETLTLTGCAVAAGGIGLTAVGFYTESLGGFAGAVQTAVELFDSIIRLASNVFSFTRLAAFGLTHAALTWLVWRASVALGHGPLLVLAVVVFCVGNVATFALEALIAGIQALRLSFYELFSRIFLTEGRTYEPWHIATSTGPRASESEALT